MKYKVKNTVTGEETICEKVVVDGFDYYTQNTYINPKDYYLKKNNKGWIVCRLELGKCDSDDIKVIATTNTSLDLPMVVDEAEWLARKEFPNNGTIASGYLAGGYKTGYQVAKETYQFTKEDMVEFAKWYQEENHESKAEQYFGFSDLDMLAKWQEQRTIEILVE